MNLNAPPSPFPIVQIHEDHDRRQSHINVSNNIVASSSSSSSSSSLSCHILFHSTQQHDAGYNYHQEDDNYAYNQSGSSSSLSSSHDQMIKNKNENKLWKKESEDEKKNYPVKWMSSKMRLKYNPTKDEEDHEKLVLGSSMDLSSSNNMMSCSYNNIKTNINNNNVIRVCSDCNTTKTPLWRSGPKGPKSLCNACGIRQRKARRASGLAVVTDEPPAHMKEIKNTITTTNNSVGKINNASSTIQLRKRLMKMTTSAAGSSSIGAGTPSIYNGPKKIEEFLVNLSNKLETSQLRVCPEDEKDAAILLMALSSGLFHTN